MAKLFQHHVNVCEKRFHAAGILCPEKRAVIARALVIVLISGFITALPVTARAEITAQVSVKDEKTYGRIVFRFFSLPSYRARIADGVLIISFKEAINLNIDQFMKPLKEYLTVGRMDPDGKSIRFALSKKIRLHTIEAGDRLFIDLLPEPWVGLPPSLPQKVIDELSAKTRQADEEKRKLARLEAFKKSKKILKVRVGQYPTFSRLVFDWKQKVGVKVSRNGTNLNIKFDKMIRTDITRLKVDPPMFVTGAKAKLTDDGLEVDIKLQADTNIRAFREGLTYVVDVSGPLDGQELKNISKNLATMPLPANMAPSVSKADKRRELVEFEAGTPAKVSEKKAAAIPMSAKKPPTQKTAMKKPALKKTIPGKPAVKKSPGTQVATKILKNNASGIMPAKNQVVSKPASRQSKTPQMVVSKSSPSGGKSRVIKAEPPKAANQQAKAKAGLPQKKQMPAKVNTGIKRQDTLRVEAAVVSGNVQLTFPFSKNVPAAVFQRGETLWVVFDTHLKLDMSAVGGKRKKYDRIAGYTTLSTRGSAAVILQLDRPSLTTAVRQKTGWMLTIGDFILSPVKPVTLKPGERSDGLSKITINLKKPASLHVFKDPQVGDSLSVITAFGPPQGIVKSQKYVEFQTIATAQGVAVKPRVDDLKISVNPEDVVITRDEGLLLSPEDGRGEIRSNRAAIDITRPGNIDFEQWAQGGTLKFRKRRAQLERKIAAMPDLKDTIAPRMELARLYVGNQLGAEALGTIEILKRIDPKVENDPLFHALRGVANLMMHRLKEARFDLASRSLSRDKDAKLWLGLLEADEGNWVQARLDFANGESAMKNYPEEIKALFRIKAARANIEVNDISNARYQLAAMPKINLERRYAAEAAFLNGRLLELLSRNDDALDYYNEALSYGDRKVESETSFYKTMLELRLRYIKPEEALKQLESQLIVWRGDETELKVMRELAKLYVDKNNFRRALETMRTAVSYYPNDTIGRLIQNDMVVLFNNLFLGGKINTMSALDSLSLYYDFRELTPIGRLGDEMIRRLSDKLISVDLLDQAAEILTHQVEKRLKGAARAQVATKLAMVHLLRRKPGKALTILRRTRQAVLPRKIARSRALLEARALSELGRYQLAISILANLKGKDVEQARASALWLGKDWQNAGEAYERVLADTWKGPEKLSDTQRIDVLRAAIAYALAEDKIGNERLISKFATKMAASSDAQTFKVITSSNGGRDAQFRDAAKKIASIDTLRGFLEEFRKAELPLSPDAASVPQG